MTELCLHVLIVLGDGPLHGYAIGKEVERSSGGRLDPATGSLYQVLKRLTDDGLIRMAAAPGTGDARRKYFELTPAGRRQAAEEIKRLDSMVRAARRRQLFRAVTP